MKTSLVIPNKIYVGFRQRYDTVNGTLSYITYIDNKGNLRKEQSWNNWKDD